MGTLGNQIVFVAFSISPIFILTVLILSIPAASCFDAAIRMGASISRGDLIALAACIVIRWADFGRGSDGRGSKIRQNGLGLSLTFGQGGEIVRDRFFFVEADLAGVGADEAFIKNAARKLVEVLVFERLQHAGADFRRVGDGLQRDAAQFALLAQFFPEGSQRVRSGGREARN